MPNAIKKQLTSNRLSVITPESIRFCVEKLDNYHKKIKQNFDCGIGKEKFTDYIKECANQHKKNNETQPYVIVDTPRNLIIGYYTLSNSSLVTKKLECLEERKGEDSENKKKEKLPRFDETGVTKIGMLAVDQRYRGKGWGAILVMDAFSRSLNISQEIASYGAINC